MITIKTIPPNQMRIEDSLGDYWIDDNGDTQIRIAETGNHDYNNLVLIHEVVEFILTQNRGITEPEIQAFDEQFDLNKKQGDNSEPGDSPDSPYRNEHRFAENIERLLCHELNINWNDYDKFTRNERS